MNRLPPLLTTWNQNEILPKFSINWIRNGNMKLIAETNLDCIKNTKNTTCKWQDTMKIKITLKTTLSYTKLHYTSYSLILVPSFFILIPQCGSHFKSQQLACLLDHLCSLSTFWREKINLAICSVKDAIGGGSI